MTPCEQADKIRAMELDLAVAKSDINNSAGTSSGYRLFIDSNVTDTNYYSQLLQALIR